MKTFVTGLLLAAVCAAAAAAAAAPISPLPLVTDNDTSSSSLLSLDFHQASCPQLPGIVRTLVDQARRQDVQVTAGLLRIFFHDCLPQGCDASIFLDGERRFGPNQSLQPAAERLIERIRDQVHKTCGPRVSCADILALATREAVNLAGGPSYAVPLGRMDSLRPATPTEIGILPGPDTNVDRLLGIFGSKGFGDPAELVALSGGHTVGKAGCGFIRPSNEPFVVTLRRQCSATRDKKQSLDVGTPDAFDNRYFVNLRNRQGVLASDQGLFEHPKTRAFVARFADSQKEFFDRFGAAMTKLGNLRGSGPVEIRRTCFARNGRVSIDDDALAAGAGDGEQGHAASA